MGTDRRSAGQDVAPAAAGSPDAGVAGTGLAGEAPAEEHFAGERLAAGGGADTGPVAGGFADVQVRVRQLDPAVGLPAYALPGDAGADIVTAVDVDLAPGERAVLPTGIAIAVPDGYAVFVHPRSGLAARAGLGLVNAPGTIDAGYRGEIKLIVINHDPERRLQLRRGERVAQLVVQRVERARFVAVAELDDTARGSGGHGSTGGAAVLDAWSGDRSPSEQEGQD